MLAYFILITGNIGNIVNLLIFTQLTLFRTNQSAFYLTLAAVVDSCQLFFGAFTRAMATCIQLRSYPSIAHLV